MVCLYHASLTEYRNSPILDPAGHHGAVRLLLEAMRLLLNGSGAVVFFFVLSGYVLRVALSRQHDVPSLKLVARFTLARAFRLFPVVIATVSVFSVIQWECHHELLDFRVFIRNALLMDSKINSVFWTLQIEWIGSILIVLVFLLERKYGVWPVVFAAMALMPLSFMDLMALHGFAERLGLLYPFFFGYLLARQSAVDRAAAKPSTKTPVLLVLLAILVFCGAARFGYVLTHGLLLITTIATTVIVAALAEDHRDSLLSAKPLQMIGQLSYSFYALHPLSLRTANHFAIIAEHGHVARPLVAMGILFGSVLMSLIICIPMYFLVERTGTAIGRRMMGRGSNQPA